MTIETPQLSPKISFTATEMPASVRIVPTEISLIDDAPDSAAELVETEPQAGLEQDQPDAQRDERLEGSSEELGGIYVVGEDPGDEAGGEQQDDRRQPQARGEQLAGDRQHHHHPSPVRISLVESRVLSRDG